MINLQSYSLCFKLSIHVPSKLTLIFPSVLFLSPIDSNFIWNLAISSSYSSSPRSSSSSSSLPWSAEGDIIEFSGFACFSSSSSFFFFLFFFFFFETLGDSSVT